MRTGPDFIVIGAMKCATTTLHEQLRTQPGIFMSRPKEPAFFSDDARFARGVDWYRSLFGQASPDDLCGESSTQYTKLPTHPHAVERLARYVEPHVRFVYVARHPIDRLVSHYIHEWSHRTISEPIDAALDRMPGLVEYGRYAMQLRPYLETFGHERVLLVFFDRLLGQPEAELQRIAEFIGYRGKARWSQEVGRRNVSNDRVRMPAWLYGLVYAPQSRRLRQALVPRRVRNRIRSMWAMRQRPELSPASIDRLRAVYDEDLAALGEWLGVPLSCQAFRAIASTTTPCWRNPPPPSRAQVSPSGTGRGGANY